MASPILTGSIFEKSCILITEKSAAGHEGYILNHKTNETVEDLYTKAKGTELGKLPVYVGGPVHTDSLNFVSITSSLEYGFKVEANIPLEYASTLVGQHDTVVLPCLGYSGWAPGQLENEFEQLTWFHRQPPLDLSQRTFKIKLWKELLEEISPYHQLIASAPKSPLAN